MRLSNNSDTKKRRFEIGWVVHRAAQLINHTLPVTQDTPVSDSILHRNVIGDVLLAATDATDASQSHSVDIVVVTIDPHVDSSRVCVIPDQVLSERGQTWTIHAIDNRVIVDSISLVIVNPDCLADIVMRHLKFDIEVIFIPKPWHNLKLHFLEVKTVLPSDVIFLSGNIRHTPMVTWVRFWSKVDN